MELAAGPSLTSAYSMQMPRYWGVRKTSLNWTMWGCSSWLWL